MDAGNPSASLIDRRAWPDTSLHCPGSWPGIYIPKEGLRRRSASTKIFGHLGVIIADCQIRRGLAIYMIAPKMTEIVLDHNGEEDLHFLSPSR